MEEELTFESIEDYQKYLKQRQELMAYCKKISQGIDNLDEKSGERAIWELVQNARDMDENCRIRIELTADSIVFSHHGKPFDYTSLLALVNQNSNKDNPGADLVGQYGTGFMTTHAFNDIVKVSAPYKAMNGPVTLKGYIHMQGFELNRSYRNNLERAIKEMGDEMQLVDDMHKRTPLYPSYEALEESQKWTSFTYGLDSKTAEAVSSQLASAVRLMPFVLVINDRIKEVEVDDQYAKRHFRVAKTANADKQPLEDSLKWYRVTDKIETLDLNTLTKSHDMVVSLQSFNQEDKVEDVVILPPYPVSCGHVSSIPSLFLWFPLLGTENFGVNFIFHSKRWHPVEKRNNIMLPENVPSKIEKGAHNESVLREMMEALHRFYAIEGNDAALTREMCVVNFHSDKEDEAHKKMLGNFVESHIERYLNDALDGLNVNIRNEQGGQDLILSKVGFEDYYIEIKSRWKDKEPAMMSSLQFHTAVDNAERYALISAQMWGFDQQRVEYGEEVPLSELYDRLRVCDNIGTLEKALLDKVEEALVYNEDEIHVVADYYVHVPQKLITQSFDELISSIIKHFTKCEE